MGEFVMSRAVFGISRDADGEGRVGEGALMLEGVLLDAAPDLLGDGQRLRVVEAGPRRAVIPAAAPGRRARRPGGGAGAPPRRPPPPLCRGRAGWSGPRRRRNGSPGGLLRRAALR